eukprot:CAMPEP_0185261352 /NCGR_PEP_ID=MMETSP1359-20130426/9750_1 /TAXON_ID=552665 /ORGANISM="Bigelowiella longifila, Strain CCMP242" /LENGTH=113 /DNA_ID=CAMNT_0027847931 /DNA_START=38 /DNA_END=379 /DNA_ORIENTATION=+
MPKKRRNRGRAKKNSGRKRRVACELSGKLVPKDKAIKRYVVRNIVNMAAISDLKEASVNPDYNLPKLYYKMYYCVGAACHRKIVRARAVKDRKNRQPPPRRRYNNDGKKQQNK